MSEETKIRLGRQLEEARRKRRWTLSDVAHRIARQPARISEMESGKGNSTVASLAAAGEVVGLSLVFVPEEQLADVLNIIGQAEPEPRAARHVGSVFEEVFIPDEEQDEGRVRP